MTFASFGPSRKNSRSGTPVRSNCREENLGTVRVGDGVLRFCAVFDDGIFSEIDSPVNDGVMNGLSGDSGMLLARSLRLLPFILPADGGKTRIQGDFVWRQSRRRNAQYSIGTVGTVPYLQYPTLHV